MIRSRKFLFLQDYKEGTPNHKFSRASPVFTNLPDEFACFPVEQHNLIFSIDSVSGNYKFISNLERYRF